MNTFVVLPFQESIKQCRAGQHDQWQGYMTVHVVNHRIDKSMSILTMVIRWVIKYDVDLHQDSVCQEVK